MQPRLMQDCVCQSTDYVYICGSGHSGSTLLEMLLAGHPDVAAVGELQNLSHQLAIGRVCSCGLLPKDCPRWQGVQHRVLEELGVDIFATPLAFRVSSARPLNTRDKLSRFWHRASGYAGFATGLDGLPQFEALRFKQRAMLSNTAIVVDSFRQLSGARLIVDSSKDYLRMRELYSYPELGCTRVIYLVRDGRGCVWSSVKRGRASAEVVSREWAKNQRRTQCMLRSVKAEHQLWLRYEDLCSDVMAVMKRVCGFLGIEYNARMPQLCPEEHHTIAGNKIRVQRRLEIRLDEEWRDGLSDDQLSRFEQIAGVEREKLGYPKGRHERSMHPIAHPLFSHDDLIPVGNRG